ncbi:membrane protein [Caballeronia zhejiangensis]|uniref:Membrane protein n=1 Tax=Caballeronia zhejiangensis TaxID=871203 RepID=A0A656QSY1_9BURK|nr:membrane protein [Caballeronia zhejiangensis]
MDCKGSHTRPFVRLLGVMISRPCSTLTDTNGNGVALDGHLTACGSRLIAYEDHGSVG